MEHSNLRSWGALGVAALALTLTGCGGGAGSAPAAPMGSVELAATGGAAPAGSLTAAAAAARRAAATDPACASSVMGDFYWEIGNATSTQPLVANAEGGGSVTADSHFNIASASKFLFGAYVLQKQGYQRVRANPALMSGLRFLSGYVGFDDQACLASGTVEACFEAGMGSKDPQATPDAVGKFDYDGGHDQKLAARDLGLGSYTARMMDAEYASVLGLSAGFNFVPGDPQMAGGEMTSASEYATFLKRVMRQELVIGAHLGDDAVCASTMECGSQVKYSPIDALHEPWHYSYNHWVESEHAGVIDAYSSPGKWGFYPWIDAKRQYYGVVSRLDKSPAAYGVSVKCGRQIRKAFLGGLGGS
jgi:hypothetical protein